MPSEIDKLFELPFEKIKREREEQEKKILEKLDELKPVANRLFSTEDGRIYARAMIRACRLLEVERGILSAEQLQQLQAQKDFVNLFLTSLINREVFMDIIKGI